MLGSGSATFAQQVPPSAPTTPEEGKRQLRETLTALEARLDPARFVRIHRRIIVAVDAIRELQPWFGGDQVLILKDGAKLRVSRSYREQNR